MERIKEKIRKKTMQQSEMPVRGIYLNQERQAAKRILTKIGLVETTSKIQKKNGTMQFSDLNSKDGLKYTLHLNGYYRKYIPLGEYMFWKNHPSCKDKPIPMTCYQLNRTKRVPFTRFIRDWTKPEGSPDMIKYEGIETQRILIPGQYKKMAERIAKIHLK